MRRRVKVKGNIKKQAPIAEKINASVVNKRPVYSTDPGYSSQTDSYRILRYG